MTITTTFTVFDPDAVSTYDFTSILRGFNIEQEVVPSKLGTGQGIFSLNNFDGDLTPNGDGTYAGVDWASCVVKLTVNRPSETVRTVFVGFIVDFTVIDDGTVSYVEFVCNDPYAIIGRGVTEESQVGSLSFYRPIGDAIEQLINVGSKAKTINGISMPTLDQTSAEAEVLDISLTDPTLFYTNTEGAGYIEDNISYGILPASLGVMWPGSYRTSGGVVYWQAYCVGEGLTADTAVSYTFTDSPTGAVDELVIGTLATGHNLVQIANSAQITTPQDSAVYASQNTTSTDKYGAKSISYGTHFEARNQQAYRFAAGMATVDLDPYCEGITNRLGTYRYLAQAVATKASMNTSTNAERAFVRLCDLLYGQWVPALVKYTPTGNATQITDDVVVTGRNIQGTPDDLRIQVRFRSSVDYQSFTLDSSLLGVLDQNRLG